MMKVQILSSGYNHQADYVEPFVSSVLKYEPKANLAVVDNGSSEKYPAKILGVVPTIRTDNLAIMTSFNRAIERKYHEWDWLILTDTDVLCRGAFLEKVSKFDPKCIYGGQRFQQGAVEWFDGWIFILSSEAWNEIGRFDDSFMLTGAFQDMDYCIRARQKGYGLRDADLPFAHLEANTTHRSPGFWENREFNKRLIQEKHGIIITRP